MIDVVEQLWDFVDLTLGMRRLQRIYFRAAPGSPEKRRALDAALVAEKLVDEAIAKLKKPSLNL
jgi:hypothetical protein